MTHDGDDPRTGRFAAPEDGAGEAARPSPAHPASRNPKALSGPQPTFADGQLIGGRYRVVRFIASGGMGEVYETEDTALKGRVALKTILPEIAADPRALERFKREIHLARRITHPNICRIYDLGSHRDDADPTAAETLFLTMELLAGETLADRIDRLGRLSTAEALPIVQQIVAGLDAAHSAGVIHRDFKSSNVMLAPAPGPRGGLRAVITDFGLARTGSSTESLASISETGVVVGTPAYMAPEQVEGQPLTPAADQYALGVALFEMVAGVRPFDGPSAISVAVKRLTQPPPSPREYVPDLDPGWEATILRCLARKPEDRFANAAEVAEALSSGTLAALRSEPLAAPETRSIAAASLSLGSEVAEGQSLDLASLPGDRLLTRARRYWPHLATLGAVLVLAGGWAAWGRLKAGAGGAVQDAAAPSATPVAMRRSVAVLGFKNVTSRPEVAWLSTAIAEMLTTDLAAGGRVRVIPGQEVARIKSDLQLAESESYSREDLARVRRGLGADLVVVGSYTRQDEAGGGLLRVDLRLQDAATGEIVGSGTTSGTESQLFALVDRASGSLRQALGLPKLSATDTVAVAAIVPSNPEAARLYSEGLARLRVYDAQGAQERLSRAVALEPKHPLLHANLAAAWSALGYESRAREAARTAAGLAASLPVQERLSVEERLYEASKEWPKAIEAARTLFDAAPDDVELGVRLAEAQVNGGKPREALQTVERLRNLAPPAGADPRIDLAEARAYHRLGEARQYQASATRAADKAQALGARVLFARARMIQATAADKLGDSKKALELIEEARAALEAAGDRGGMAQALERIGIALFSGGDYDGSRRMLEKALSIRREIGDQTGGARVQANLGNVLFSQGRLAEAQKLYDEAIAAFRRADARYEAALTLNGIGARLAQSGDLAGAARRYREAFDLFSAIGRKDGVTYALTNLGEVQYLRGNLAESQSLHEDSLATNREIGDKTGQAYDLYRLGEVFSAKGDLKVASDRYSQALKLQQKGGDATSGADTQVGLARLAIAENRPVDAERLAREAEEVLRSQKADDRAALARLVLAEALLAQKKLDAARAEAQRARDQTSKSQDPKVRLAGATLVARVQAASLQAADVDGALRDLNGVVAECSKAGLIPCQLEARLAIGFIEQSAGRAGAGSARLKALAADATAKGFGFIARQALPPK